MCPVATYFCFVILYFYLEIFPCILAFKKEMAVLSFGSDLTLWKSLNFFIEKYCFS